MEELKLRARSRRRRRVISSVSGLLVLLTAGVVWRLDEKKPGVNSDRTMEVTVPPS